MKKATIFKCWEKSQDRIEFLLKLGPGLLEYGLPVQSFLELKKKLRKQNIYFLQRYCTNSKKKIN